MDGEGIGLPSGVPVSFRACSDKEAEEDMFVNSLRWRLEGWQLGCAGLDGGVLAKFLDSIVILSRL